MYVYISSFSEFGEKQVQLEESSYIDAPKLKYRAAHLEGALWIHQQCLKNANKAKLHNGMEIFVMIQ